MRSRDFILGLAVAAGKADHVKDILHMIAVPTASKADDTGAADTRTSASSTTPVVAHDGSPAAPAMAPTIAPAGTAQGLGPRWQALADAGFNPLNLSADHVDFDLKTESWAQLRLPAIDQHMANPLPP